MKLISYIIISLVLILPSRMLSQNTWTQKSDFGGAARSYGIGFSVGGYGYTGLGLGTTFYKDLWKYDPGANSWSQQADFPGTGRQGAVSFVINALAYVGTGTNISNYFTDFYEYNPASNAWTQKADFPGSARQLAVGFSVNSKGYIGLGSNTGNYYADVYEFDPALNSWIQKEGFPATARDGAVAFSIANTGYIALGQNGSTNYQDLWAFDPVNNTWTQKPNLPSSARNLAVGFTLNSRGYVGTGGNSFTDFWEYDQTANQWTQKANFGGNGRTGAVGFSIGTNGYLGTGMAGGNTKDFWQYTPTGTYSAPIVSTTTANNITNISAFSGGNVTSDGNSLVLARGVCWDVNSFPTIANNKSNDGIGSGTFTSFISGLNYGTIYHYRAYATNSVGTSYGNDYYFESSVDSPTITTDSIAGNPFCPGGTIVVPFTVVWAFNQNNIFTALVSDSSGSFVHGKVIGNIIGTGSGTITGVLPSDLPPGPNYLVNVIASDPGVIGSYSTNNIVIAPVPTPLILGNFTSCRGGVQTFTSNADLTTNVFGRLPAAILLEQITKTPSLFTGGSGQPDA